MTAEFLVGSVVPLAVIVAMLAVGLNLDLSALRDSLRQPRSFLVCLVLQLLLLPAAVLGMIALTSPQPLFAAVMFAVAISPVGTISNALTHLARGNLALSVIVTVATTLLVSLTAPATAGIVSWVGLGEVAMSGGPSPSAIALDLLVVALLPISIGATLAALLPGPVARVRRTVDLLCALAVMTVVVCSAIVSWSVVRSAASDYLLPAGTLSLTLLAVGGAVAALLPPGDRIACVIVFCLRNLPIAIVLSAGVGPPVEILAFLLCHFVINSALLLALVIAHRRGRRLAAPSNATEKQSVP